MENNLITSEVLVAYSQCPRKAFFLLFTEEKGTPHEYNQILEQQKNINQAEYISVLKQKNFNVKLYDAKRQDSNNGLLTEATLTTNELEAYCDLLRKVEDSSSLGKYSYEPIQITGTYSVTKEQTLKLLFAGYVLEQIQNKLPATGTIISMGGQVHELKLTNGYKRLKPFIEPIREWITAPPSEAPTVILNKHCPYCQFQASCKAKAEKDNDLSLLAQMTAKAIQNYHKKGIFTVTQLSYLFKPRRRRKSKKKSHVQYKLELQALAIRTEKIYLQELPELARHQVELFLDIEGIPDQNFHYLVGLLVCEENNTSFHSFWADTIFDEEQLWIQFIKKVNEYPEAPIYHYGSYEPKAIAQLAKRYQINCESITKRLVNINTYIYGKIYFPIRSNSLKEIGKFIGASWTAPNASGLQSLVWRHQWEAIQNPEYKQMLVTYNEEDCRALKLLTTELSKIKDTADLRDNIDFVNQPKQISTEIGEQIHSQFDAILKFAHADYNKDKISLQPNQNEPRDQGKKKPRKRGPSYGHQGYHRIAPKARKVICVPSRITCPKCKSEPLQNSDKISERTIIDLVFTNNGCKKTVTKYVGTKSYCPNCCEHYSPGLISELGEQLFGHGFQAWLIYQRLVLRLPYRTMIQVMEDLFHESISPGTIVNFLNRFASYYSDTEKDLIQNILKSPFIHADETSINIQGTDYYVWVFTDGKHVVFKMTETREATIVYDLLSDYNGVLVSDFYPGYDSVKCRQQKCLVHLIRDLNDDLWKAPFDVEFEVFLSEVRNLIIPILQAVEKYGSKQRHLSKFRKIVEEFYARTILNRLYHSELTIKYQKRFERYKQSLFTFLEQDSVPWNNNTAERALRHLAVQRKISGSFFKSGATSYLTLLGILQTCRFQDKSLLKFLMSGEKDIDKFKASKRTKDTKSVGLPRSQSQEPTSS